MVPRLAHSLDQTILDADGFAGVFPEPKYEIVKRIQGLGHLCAVTADRAKDAPALSRANVRIAIEGGIPKAAEGRAMPFPSLSVERASARMMAFPLTPLFGLYI